MKEEIKDLKRRMYRVEVLLWILFIVNGIPGASELGKELTKTILNILGIGG